MRLIEFYILRRVIIGFGTVLIAVAAISWTVQVLGRINFLTTNSYTFHTVIQFSSLLIPSSIAAVMPFALVIAIAQTLTQMNQDSELIVINASGIPRSVILRPILSFALAVSILSFIIANFIVPYMTLNMRTIIANARADLLNGIIQEGTFHKLTDNLYIQIAERKDDGRIGGLFIADSRDPTVDLIYSAVDGVVASNANTNLLVMQNGELQRRDVKTGNVSIIKFNSYAFDLSEFTSAMHKAVTFVGDQPLTYLLNPDPNDPEFQKKPLLYKTELHKRFTDWLYPFVFALITLLITGDPRSHREEHISASFLSVSISLIIYWIKSFANAIYLMDTIPFCISVFAIYLIATGRHLSLSTEWLDILQDRLAKMLFSNLHQRKIGKHL